MKLKKIIYICIVILIIIISVGLIYNNSALEDDNTKNNTKIANTTNSTSNITNNNTNNNTNTANISTNNINPNNDRDNVKHNNLPNNMPKKSRLSYTEAFKLATKIAKNVYEDSNVYVKYNGYRYNSRVHIEPTNNHLYWSFKVYNSTNNKWLNGFLLEDATGRATQF
ncbi:hypothetical protein [Methanobrevibacter curvatus]|uniref:Uncharacterized protein n=1 Tax=Methanobrevibacter curvatus TaxID=49547 RepID=A0A166CPF8_9EURY|nr:hypothetical protein [Methanobrevibacter curvatus]KZX14729.1 hypothetical protein MBCUR_03790 [Methanobrevibacter curvatus]